MPKENVPSQLNTPNDLPEKNRNEIITHLNVLVADAFGLYVKTKNFHWHLAGPHFRDYHLLFDEQAGQIYAMIDVLAERVRKLGGTTIRSIGHINNLKTIQDSDESFVPADMMVQQLLNDNKAYATSLRKTHKACDEGYDVATNSILEIFLDETERRIWFLFEILSTKANSK